MLEPNKPLKFNVDTVPPNDSTFEAKEIRFVLAFIEEI